jgi:hypothetical protein
MRFMYARLAYVRLRAALFDDAGSLFQKSKLDPRFVVALFPKYAGRSIPDDQELAIWRGLLGDSTEVKSIDEIGKFAVCVGRYAMQLAKVYWLADTIPNSQEKGF